MLQHATHQTPRRILITGATRGLGRAMTEEFIRLGHVVIGCGRDEAVIRRLRAAHGAPHRFDAVDVANNDQVRHWAEAVLRGDGAPDLLLNNAAVIAANAPLWKVPAAEFDRVIDINVKGIANVIRHFVPAMVETGKGVIVNFSSGWGRGTSAEVAPYCASKWAVEGLTRSLAQELPPGIAAVPLNPGVIDTDMLRGTFGDEAGDYPTPEEWVKTAVPFILALDAGDNGKPVTVPAAA